MFPEVHTERRYEQVCGCVAGKAGGGGKYPYTDRCILYQSGGNRDTDVLFQHIKEYVAGREGSV